MPCQARLLAPWPGLVYYTEGREKTSRISRILFSRFFRKVSPEWISLLKPPA